MVDKPSSDQHYILKYDNNYYDVYVALLVYNKKKNRLL